MHTYIYNDTDCSAFPLEAAAPATETATATVQSVECTGVLFYRACASAHSTYPTLLLAGTTLWRLPRACRPVGPRCAFNQMHQRLKSTALQQTRLNVSALTLHYLKTHLRCKVPRYLKPGEQEESRKQKEYHVSTVKYSALERAGTLLSPLADRSTEGHARVHDLEEPKIQPAFYSKNSQQSD
ncbi:hypothetical protein KQX54_009964 [Cotesia glomerata]|uniref:Uncharacterized protein n=1 Tax=Cotesia glomerata TaxID=32391 RepID=A0AAV7IEI0_COTGL|nr:hypothetical protein KQX54_009964 [Cotesia glomerata]